MSIKTLVKDHFSNSPISEHLEYFFPHNHENNISKPIFTDNKLNIRRFALKDLDECSVLFKQVFSSSPWYDEWVSLDQTKTYLNELVKNPVFDGFVICEASKVVGTCLGHSRSWWMGKEFFIDEFFVANDRQGEGMGTKLLDCVSEYLNKEGYTRLTLLTNKKIPAEKFYLKNGFYNNPQRTIMIKDL
jgi:ribosomal protein S18 acetylase RimI-like enzyme